MIILKMSAFILGIYMAMRMIAAIYGIIDYWYTIKTAYLKVFQRIIGWGMITAVLILLFSQYRKAFLWGMATYGIFYLFSFLSLRIPLIKEVKSTGIK